MAVSGHGDHQLKRIVLPSGKTIEVVYFGHPAAAPPRGARSRGAVPPRRVRSRPTPAERELCMSAPSATRTSSTRSTGRRPTSTTGTSRCAARTASGRRTASSTRTLCDRFDEELERGTDALTRDYKRFVTANLAEEIDRFVHALEVGGILPMDF